MKIFIRADGGKDIGLGHIMRMLVLGEELQKSNEVGFICRNSISNKFEAGIKKIKEKSFKVIEISEEDYIGEIIEMQTKHNADVLITDSYDVDEEYFIKLKEYFRFTGYVDDVNKCKMDVDFIINQNINADDLYYWKNVGKNTKLLLGTQYCMLRNEFRQAYKSKVIKKEIQDILLTLGGMDNNNNTLKILEKIKDINKNLHVVIGSAFDKDLIEKIQDITKKHNNIYIYENANMDQLMLKCDVAISACGSTLYELAAMSVPTIGVVLAENQKFVAEKMKEMNLIYECFEIGAIEKINLLVLLNKLIEDEMLRYNIIKKEKALVNLYGVESLAKEINGIIRG
ncbi:UDP-2,4-diacetamido-2,4,6-trideoxy-beta-L-altropyranose hydrolase [Clostridium saccharoperbutylacetonicum]|uniref:UDP-2,4-diacetamido-2,4, 6-trideoxy-beta-L-altropyranose hydrolase n=1 Tax=Clostridium saccharoperbutylacetonicum TaxID=36745 RepID=UPI00098395B7|nr:UDP-2,4-diacetamido-2,4,6-trideoxy-beta-L-altropyranose hydrolase [Clostridium saccharoperbutylacetonicum]AQR96971.1 UDP-2,4-diacetamido-2,4,6-trideoxy-beta-L-altropyranose hydrolase [Clostridium saccharoperbutylacetonicum]NSB32850.1 UDP-2,4-diacetamido-2,4,6-trideoxy-beta-L-altropyranose hydrolase [Clostridium saccharoperbutylacetonicum]